MKKVLFASVAALVGVALAVESENVVGYAKTDMKKGASIITAQFLDMSTSDGGALLGNVKPDGFRCGSDTITLYDNVLNMVLTNDHEAVFTYLDNAYMTGKVEDLNAEADDIEEDDPEEAQNLREQAQTWQNRIDANGFGWYQVVAGDPVMTECFNNLIIDRGEAVVAQTTLTTAGLQSSGEVAADDFIIPLQKGAKMVGSGVPAGRTLGQITPGADFRCGSDTVTFYDTVLNMIVTNGHEAVFTYLDNAYMTGKVEDLNAEADDIEEDDPEEAQNLREQAQTWQNRIDANGFGWYQVVAGDPVMTEKFNEMPVAAGAGFVAQTTVETATLKVASPLK